MGQGLCCALPGLQRGFLLGLVVQPKQASSEPSAQSPRKSPAVASSATADPVVPGNSDLGLRDVEAQKPSAHPLDSAGITSRIWVSWLSSLVTLAGRRPLQEEDVWDLPADLCPDATSRSLERSWSEELAAAEARGRQPRLERALLRAFWRDLLSSALMLFLFACTNLTQPFFIRGLFNYLRAGSADPLEVGIAYASAMLVFSALSSFFVANYFRLGSGSGIRMKAAITGTVFRRSLELSASSRALGSVGQTTNLMAVDAEKFLAAVQFVHFVWLAPLATTFVGVLLTATLGPSALAGLGLIVVLWPVQMLLASRGGRARKRAMAFTDERVKFATEVVRGIRAVKLCAWEDAVFERLCEVRRSEAKWLSASLFLKAAARECILMILPPSALAVVFALERARGVLVDETVALMALGFLNTLRFPLNLFSYSLNTCQDGLVSCSRLREFLLRPALAQQLAPEAAAGCACIDVSDARFAWGPAGHGPCFQLRVPTLRLAGPGRTAVLGRVASGKTSLLAAVLGEMRQLEGRCKLRGRVAFMGQTPWIQNLTLRDNILFGRRYDEELYCRALAAAALAPDLVTLKDGDLTEIGERGINLSGGQKARVGLARCLYAVALGDRDALILDCPFDALDIATGQRVFEGIADVARGALLVCSMSAQVHLLRHFGRIVVVESGAVAMDGEYAAVAAAYPELVDTGEAAAEGGKPPALAASSSGGGGDDVRAMISRPRPAASGAALTSKDRGKTGGIPASLVLSHLGQAANGGTVAGGFVALVLLVLFLSSQALRVASDVLVTAWGSGTASTALTFGALGLCAKLLSSRVGAVAFVSLRTAVGLHRRALRRLLRAPVVEYFDVTTTGEILNKLSKDLDTVDSGLPETCTPLLSNLAQLVVIVVLSTCAIPWFLAVMAVLGFLFVTIGRRFSPFSRDLKRLDGSTRSPVYNCFSETLTGLETIRAWRAQGQFVASFQRRHRHNTSFSHAVAMSESWVMARLESISCTIIGAFAFSAVAMRGSVEPRFVGLALVYAIQLTAMLQRTVQLWILMGQQLTACERVRSLERTPQEPPALEARDVELPAGWPSGGIAFEGVHLRYRDGGLVLRGVSFEVAPGQRVGVCGRTGAGKSTLLAALFRLAEPCGGTVRVSGVDISKVGVRTLRGRLSIIPQEPVIFSGTIRSNLDPFGTVGSDEELVGAMCRVGLTELAREPGLDGAVAEHGENLSQGQRQLLCIARAMLRGSRVTALDEATSAMDAETDRAVQRALAEHWRAAAGDGGTVLTIAHRLRTILDHDRILVLSFGEVAEFDTPARLLSRRDGALSRMLREEPSASS